MTVACKECGHKQKSLKGAMAVNKVHAILARFPGPVTLRVSRLKMLGLLAGSLAFVVGSIFLIVFVKGDPETLVAGIAGVLFFGACAVIGAVMLLPGAGSLTLDVQGFEVCSFFLAICVRIELGAPARIANYMLRRGWCAKQGSLVSSWQSPLVSLRL